MIDRKRRDPEGRWVFDFDHVCGHREMHRIRVPEGTGFRFPTELEQDLVLGDLMDQPCHACMTGQPVGTAMRVFRVAEGLDD